MKNYDYSNLLTVVRNINNETNAIHAVKLSNLKEQIAQYEETMTAITEEVKQLNELRRELGIDNLHMKLFDNCYISNFTLYNYVYAQSGGSNYHISFNPVTYGYNTDDMFAYSDKDKERHLNHKYELLKLYIDSFEAYRDMVLKKIYCKIGTRMEENEAMRKEV